MQIAAQPTLHPSYRPDIDGLRAVAVLSVVGYHAFPARLAGGFTGVDIFFVISGFLISTIIFSNVAIGRFSFFDFFGRRVRRIFPALLLVLASCYAFGWFALFADEFEELGKHIAAGAGFVSNLVLWSESGYFDAAAERKPLLHLWSLGIEEQFYIVWPLLVWLAWKVRLNQGALVAVLLASSFALNLATVASNPVAAFYSPLSRFWELLVGAGLAWWTLKRRSGDAAPESTGGATVWRELASFGGIALIAAALLVTRSDAQFPGWWALLPTCGAALLIAAGTRASINRIVLANPLFVWVGLISYPLYLWHWPALFAARTMGIGEPPAWVRLLAVAIAVVLATLTYQLIEKPIRRGRHHRTVTASLVGLMVLMGGVGFYTYSREGLGFRYAASPNDLKEREWHLNGEGVSDCSKLLDGTPSAFCATAVDATVALIGDSHAGALFHGVINNAVDARFRRAIVMGAGSCQATLGVESAPHCSTQLNVALRRIRQDPRITTVVIAGYARFLDGVTPSLERQYLEGYDRTIRTVTGAGKRVLFVIDNPTFKKSAEFCQPRTLYLRSIAGKVPAFCSTPSSDAVLDQRRYRAFVQQLQARHPNVSFFDASAVLCEDGSCPLFADGGELLYGDNNHLSLYGSRMVADQLVRFILNR